MDTLFDRFFMSSVVKSYIRELFLVFVVFSYDDKIQIYFNLPIKDKSPDNNSQGLLFYTKEIVLYEKTSVIYYCF